MSERLHSTRVVKKGNNDKLAVWMFLGGEVIFFTTLILTLIYFRITQAKDYLPFREHLSVPLVGVNTFILIASSYLVVRALSKIQEGNGRSMVSHLIGVIVLGALFLGGQAFEWFTLFGEGEGFSTRFGTPFFTVTGIHGTHVFIGLIWAAMLLFEHRRKPFQAAEHKSIEVFGLYWHFVDIVWIMLFTIIYLI